MYSHYQHQPTSYGNLSLIDADPRYGAHALINDLDRRASKLAPRFAYETSDAGATNLRPGNDHPRQQQVWDMQAESLSWNLIADNPEAVAHAVRLERAGRGYQVGHAAHQVGERADWYYQEFVVDLGAPLAQAEYVKYQAFRTVEDEVAKGQTLVTRPDPARVQVAADGTRFVGDPTAAEDHPEPGDRVEDFRGEVWIYRYVSRPYTPGKSAKVVVSKAYSTGQSSENREFYAQVFPALEFLNH